MIEADPGYHEFIKELEENKSEFYNKYINSEDFKGGVKDYNQFLFDYCELEYGAGNEGVENEAYFIGDY